MSRWNEKVVKMFAMKSMMVALVGSLLLVASSAQANLFSNGDMEGAGSPPAPWSENGANGGANGSVTMSLDTPTGSGQSIQVIDLDGDLTTYGLDYTDQPAGGFPDGDYVLSYDYKGGLYSKLDVQTPTMTGSLDPGSTEWFSTANWASYQKTVTVVGGGVNGFSFTIWNNYNADRPALVDNLSLTQVVVPEPSTMTLTLICIGGLALLRRRRK